MSATDMRKLMEATKINEDFNAIKKSVIAAKNTLFDEPFEEEGKEYIYTINKLKIVANKLNKLIKPNFQVEMVRNDASYDTFDNNDVLRNNPNRQRKTKFKFYVTGKIYNSNNKASILGFAVNNKLKTTHGETLIKYWREYTPTDVRGNNGHLVETVAVVKECIKHLKNLLQVELPNTIFEQVKNEYSNIN
jgi:hypothetical protein